MGTRSAFTTLAALCSVYGVSACHKGNEAPPATETGQTVQEAPPSAESGEESKTVDVEILRDSARASVGRDSAAVTRALRSAADFARRQAGGASETAREAYTRSAAEMDSLATSISAGAKRTGASLDSAFARLDYAEAVNHMAAAMDAWAAQQRSRAAEELEATTEALERAAQDARIELDEATRKAARDGKALAAKMKGSAELKDQEVRRAMAELDTRIRQLSERITKKS